MAERDIALTILDYELVDDDGERCGRVDDIELELRDDGSCAPVALVVGRESARRRLGDGRFGRLVCRLMPVEERRISWDQISEITHVVKLRNPAGTYGLARTDTKLAPFIERIPGG
jgi:sporulation protein YlmC with PRC-barrel domain